MVAGSLFPFACRLLLLIACVQVVAAVAPLACLCLRWSCAARERRKRRSIDRSSKLALPPSLPHSSSRLHLQLHRCSATRRSAQQRVENRRERGEKGKSTSRTGDEGRRGERDATSDHARASPANSATLWLSSFLQATSKCLLPSHPSLLPSSFVWHRSSLHRFASAASRASTFKQRSPLQVERAEPSSIRNGAQQQRV